MGPLPLYFHNSMGFDNHLLLKHFPSTAKGRLSGIPTSEEKFKCLNYTGIVTLSYDIKIRNLSKPHLLRHAGMSEDIRYYPHHMIMFHVIRLQNFRQHEFSPNVVKQPLCHIITGEEEKFPKTSLPTRFSSCEGERCF